MSFAIDVNVLLYASNVDAPQQAEAIRFLRDVAERKELIGIPYPVALGYLRIATHPRIFPHPLTPEEALSNLGSLAALPNVRFLSEREGFFEDYREMTASISARGNLVPDAHTATILRQHDIHVLYTADRDFRRFAFLDVRDPFTPAAR
jgi:uncharacterized protein